MKRPFYLRKWFFIGMIFIAAGLFINLLSHYELDKYETSYPHLGQSERARFLDQLKQPDKPTGETAAKLSKEEVERDAEAKIVHGLYGMYQYVGIISIVLGIIFALLSFKEPQVPTIEDLDDSPPSNG